MAILDQAKPDWRYRFDKVYFVGLLNYIAWKDRTQAITEVALYTSDDHILTNNNYLQIFVELPKLAADKDGEGFSTYPSYELDGDGNLKPEYDAGFYGYYWSSSFDNKIQSIRCSFHYKSKITTAEGLSE